MTSYQRKYERLAGVCDALRKVLRPPSNARASWTWPINGGCWRTAKNLSRFLRGPSPQPGEPPACVDVQPQKRRHPSGADDRTEDLARRERKAKRLAAKLFFKLDRQGIRYSLRRTAGVSGTVRRENLSLDEVERELDMWKLRGPHGG